MADFEFKPTGTGPEPLSMSLREYELIVELIKREFGYTVKGDKRVTLHLKLSHRLNILHLDTYEQYYDYIISQPSGEELIQLVSHVTNNETFFFRETTQLEAFRAALAEIKEVRENAEKRTLNVLSAGCSSGEEAYTLNIIIQESGLFNWGWNISVTGMDVDPRALQKASEGRYMKNSLRTLNGDLEFVKKHFHVEGDIYAVKDSFRPQVKFIRGNILSREDFSRLPMMDVIFCRNVLIYMDDPTIAKIAENFSRVLNPDGYVFLGASESMIQKTDLLVPHYRHGSVVYRRPEPQAGKG